VKSCIAVGYAACLAALVLGSRAQAAETRLDYRAPAGCPAEPAFVSEVETRGGSFAAATAARERWLNVVIEADSGGFAGSLQVRDAQNASEPRRVHAPTCAEVGQALAVVTAIALQADAPEAATAAPSAPPPAASVPAPAPIPVPSSVLNPIWSKDSVPVSAGNLRFDYEAGYTLSAGAQFGLIPGQTLPRLDFAITRANTVTTPAEENFLLGTVFRVRWTVFPAVEINQRGFNTKVVALKAGVSGCTPFTYDRDALVLKFCSEFAVGALGLETRDRSGAKTQEKEAGIGTAGVEFDARYTFASIFHVGLTLGGEAWFTRITAESPDGARLFKTSFLNGYALAGVGVHF
jgi:hypothetical protein